ncbi:MAG: tripartite tricarboxylate transporter substrate binding protein BugD [Hyphomicrobiales bacterium]|uniref:tripartite tricarboxylate transporter substrate-binding protein n=1 Tax=Rhabdaerophilum calidifontis TaxID=2604328 RepID=UPI00123C092B|nr:tripartite tricarboxylate transporter substrate-binding protein [Rhabdaerophilum calidifontis]MCA1952983.1 tripartite tricarboxylate transporter substrate binding protein BugD [Hyphomicrobiales bacterium]MCA1999408.1 tripartite tricarboxylate transporter substrate binding protein BugD [Hyphomicrobiales bacterium]
MSGVEIFRHIRRRAALALGAAALVLAGTGAAGAFPTKPVTIIVPFAAGGPSDTIARLFAASMGQTLGGQVIVENVAGAGSTIGIGRVAKAAPDGHTLLVSHISHATTASLYKTLTYDPVGDFAPVGMMTDGAFVLVSRKDFPAGSVAELFQKIKAGGEKISYAHAGVGSGSHLCGLMIQNALGARMNEIPYRGTGPALSDIVSGKVDLLCDQITSALPQIQGGSVKAHAVTSKAPVAALKLPTVAESGIKDFEITIWHGLYAPKGTPADVIAKLNGALKAALKDPTILKRLDTLSTIAATEKQANPDFLRQRLVAEIANWKGIIEKAGIKAE